ncbi:hypothetical protein [Burkholderia pseudomallei]|uniref:hypothetical protein n=1 Tax=Burkholderia pseudomallei TaxID=28450 RepID=UPI000F08C8AA|nr:hypothetical protein [Burkholderia pseudomallei]CAJ3078153.1 Uncharacterised protein [Burkholderia pseudomallei]VCK72360.1 Uncharacterised protein [Burkholderia pseudomallei]VCK79782.1 Uncharacterised protein [Burkholderia pseudomallei]VCK80223.1 Uncharacterised protein [Burkholderia pseudomallei]VCK80608.1 Uncharacterised protein [Burkholderia pseudomallei]
MSNKPQSNETNAGNDSQNAPRKEKPKSVIYGWEKIQGEDGKDEFRAQVSFTPTSHENTFTGMVRDIHGRERKALMVVQTPRPQRETGEMITDLVVSENRAAPGQEPDWKTIAIGHPVNGRSDGKPVDFSVLLFSPRDEDFGTTPIRAKVTAAITPEIHKRLGFTQPRIMPDRTNGEREQDASRGEQPAPAAASQTTQASRGKEDPLDVKPDETPAKSARKSRPKARAAQREVAENAGPSM